MDVYIVLLQSTQVMIGPNDGFKWNSSVSRLHIIDKYFLMSTMA